ncbi:uncharacterized protein SOCG_00680 [Schizosaccharomyces octosporus yFS286]|uniref:Fungal protein n=1 Tax=Schizosaccharomyces octosporus (strain yFS286) TaxID=483514 RepID=S9PZN4_SCHOY|nr:uncharacterized protein SOCG_00680 [Schizosaccharomyces octosporus yFS286]EPX72918.1 fungal protein [Schizosaccharomyces octosporus yFS286]
MSGYKKDTNFGQHKVSEFGISKNPNDESSNKFSRTMSATLRSNPTESDLLLNMLRPDVAENKKQHDGLPDCNPSPIANGAKKSEGSPHATPRQPFFNSFNPFDFLEATSPLLQRPSSSLNPETTKKRDVSTPVKINKQQDAYPLTIGKGDVFQKEQKFKSKSPSPLRPFTSPTKEEGSGLEESQLSQLLDDDNGVPHEVYSIDPPLGRSFTIPPSCISSPLLVESFQRLAKLNLPYNYFYEPLALADKKNQYAAYVNQNLNQVCVSNVDTMQRCILDCENQVVYLGFGEDSFANVYLLATNCEGKASVWKISDGANNLSTSLVLSIKHSLLRDCTWVSGDSNLVGVLVKNKYYVIQVSLNQKSVKIGPSELFENSLLMVEAPSTINSCSLSKDKTVLALLVDSKVYLYQVTLSANTNTEKQHLSTPFAFIDLHLPSPANSVFCLSTSKKDGTFLDRILCVTYNQSSTLFLFDFGCRQVTQEINLKNKNRKFSPHLLGVTNKQDLISSISADYLDIFSYCASSFSPDLNNASTFSFIMSVVNREIFGESGYIGTVMSKTILDDGILFSNMISENDSELNLLLALTSGYYLLNMDADCFSREGKSLDYPTPEQSIIASAHLEKVDKGMNVAPAIREFKLPSNIKETESNVFEYASSVLGPSSSEHLETIVETVLPQEDEVSSFVNMLLKKRVNEILKQELPNQIDSIIKPLIGLHLNATLDTKIKETAEECSKEPLEFYDSSAIHEEGDSLKKLLEKIRVHNQEKATAMSDLAKRVSATTTLLEKKINGDDGSYSMVSNNLSHHLDNLSKMIEATKNEEALIYFTEYPNVHMFRMLKKIPDYALDECSFIHLLTFIYTLSTFIFTDDDLKKLCIQLMSRAISRLRAMKAPSLIEKDNFSPEVFPAVVDITLKNVETILVNQVVPSYEAKYEFLKTSLKSLNKELRTSYGL